MRPRPSLVWRTLLRLGVGREEEFLTGDLLEGFTHRAETLGARRARRWYRRQVIGVLIACPRRRAQRARRPVRGDVSMLSFLQDVKYGARLLVNQPLFSLVVVTTLALAIGANTVIFSFANPLLLRPLPIRDPDTVAWIWSVDSRRNIDRGRLSVPDFSDLRSRASVFASLAALRRDTLTLTGRGDATQVETWRITSNLFDIWALDLDRGRRFRPDDEAAGAPPVVILSHGFWRRQFVGDPGMVGETLMLDGVPHLVVGVLTPAIEFGNLAEIDVWTPLTLDPAAARRDERVLQALGRLQHGVTHDAAQTEVAAITGQLERDHPATNTGWTARVARTKEAITGGETWTILALLGTVVGLVLLIACANLANLMLARAAERQRELAVRAALGAGRARLVRQLVTENVLLGLAGGLAALGLAHGGLKLIRAAASEAFFDAVTIDGNVLAFVAVISLLTPFLFGLLPALYSSRSALSDTLRQGFARVSGSVAIRRSRATLVVSQLAMALALLAVAGLLVRTLIATQQVDLGIAWRGLLTFQIDVPRWKYADEGAVARFEDRLIGRLRTLPGVTAVAAADRLPIIGGERIQPVTIDGRSAPTPADQPWAVAIVASEEYFSAAGIPILTGRAFRTSETAAAIVSVEMARRYWSGPERAIGARISVGDRTAAATWLTIVGVAGDTKPPDYRRTANPQIYLPLRGRPTRDAAFLVRADNADTMHTQVRALVRSVDADLAVYDLRTMDQAFADELSSNRILIALFVAFAGVAVALAAAGLYGVISYSVSQRTQEIGIRIAIGALPGDVMRLIFRQALKLVATGAVIGLAGGLLIGQAMRSVLFGVGAADPATYGGMLLLLVVVAVLASWLPARRAMRVDPIRALRAE